MVKFYCIEEREQIQNFIIKLAKSDNRISDAAIVGSQSIGNNDKWSDIDLTFGVKNNVPITNLLIDWTEILKNKYQAFCLFDVSYKTSVYRVFLFPNCLQVDISFTPSPDFGAITPKFKLLFGKSNPKQQKSLPNMQELYGHAVHHALRARFSIERNRFWQAVYWLNTFRDCVLTLACIEYGLNPFDGRGLDNLPLEIKKMFTKSLSFNLTKEGLKHSLKIIVSGLLIITENMPNLKTDVNNQLKWIGGLK